MFQQPHRFLNSWNMCLEHRVLQHCSLCVCFLECLALQCHTYSLCYSWNVVRHGALRVTKQVFVTLVGTPRFRQSFLIMSRYGCLDGLKFGSLEVQKFGSSEVCKSRKVTCDLHCRGRLQCGRSPSSHTVVPEALQSTPVRCTNLCLAITCMFCYTTSLQ